MARVPLPGLANLNLNQQPDLGTSSNSDEYVKVNKMTSVPKGKNPFERVGVWTGEHLEALQVKVGPIEETTEQTRRSQTQNEEGGKDVGKPAPKTTRHWRSNVVFTCNGYESKVIKNFGAGVPRVKTRAYGDNYCYASLQKSIADKIIKAYAEKNIRVTHVEDNVHGSDEEWWATINNMAGRTGFIIEKQFAEKSLATVLAKRNGGVTGNIDIVVYMKLKKEGNMERDPNDVFTLAVECSRFVITAHSQDIPPPEIRSQVPSIALAKQDMISDELARELNDL
jgi:hypothetical protein